MTEEQKTRLAWLRAEEFVIRTNKYDRVYFVDLDKESKGKPTPACDVTDLWYRTSGLTPQQFANLMMDHANERYCQECKHFYDELDIVIIDQDYGPSAASQVCTNCADNYAENDMDEYERNGVSRYDFI